MYNYSVPAASNTRVSYNGGRGGINARPLPAEQVALREPHQAPVAAQVQHIRQAASNREQFAAVNRGRPQVVAAAAPLATSYRTPAPRPAAVAQALARPNSGARPGQETGLPKREDLRREDSSNPALVRDAGTIRVSAVPARGGRISRIVRCLQHRKTG